MTKQAIRHKTWNIIYKISSFNGNLNARYAEISKREPLVQKLYHTDDQAERRELYLKVCEKDPETCKAAIEFFNKVFYFCFRKGFKKVSDWVSNEENDPVKWDQLFKNERFNEIIKKYARHHAETRKKDLNLQQYHNWDYWYKNTSPDTNCLYTNQVVPNFKQSLGLIKDFYKDLGFEDIFSQIDFIQKEGSPTYAMIHEKNGIWLNEVYLSESGAGCKTGSLNYLSVITHETGHIIQSRQIKYPHKHFFLPPNPLNEIVTMFFERLFLSPAFLSRFPDVKTDSNQIYKELKTENEELLLRTLNLLEYEDRIYALVQKNKLTDKLLADINSELKQKYYGFEPNDLEDHSWHRWCFYLAYSPFKQRAYILGNLLSRIMLDNFLKTLNNNQPTQESIDYLHNMITTCSENGSFSTWQEYEKACSLDRPIDTEFVVNGIAKALSQG
ncbi:MAG: hypothetical protein HQM16_14895 [Deltaproteobacteria bacterium]|nr:hypothetical protein [Deltaproteobacteria bacterium]